MLLTIHNLPTHVRFADIKSLILCKCGFSEVILDNLVNEGNTKKVTVGLAEEEDAAILTRSINGLYYEGKQLYVRDVRQKAALDQPYYKSNMSSELSQDSYQAPTNSVQAFQGYPTPGQSNQGLAQGNQGLGQGFQPGQFINPQQMMGPEAMMQMMMAPNMMGGMYFMPQMGSSFMDSGGQQVAAVPQFSQVAGQPGPTGNLGADSKQNPFRQKRSGGLGDRANREPSPNPKRGRYEDTYRSNDKFQRKGRESKRRSRSPDRRRFARDRTGGSNSQSRTQDYQQQDDRRDDNNPWASRQGGLGSGSFDNKSQGETSRPQFDNGGLGRNNWNQQTPFDKTGQGQSEWRNQGSFKNDRQVINPWNNKPRSDDNSQERNIWNKQTSFDNSNQDGQSWNSQAFDEHAQGRSNWSKSSLIRREPTVESVPEKSNWNRHQALKNQNQSQNSWNRDDDYSSGKVSKPQSKWGGRSTNSQSPDRRNPPNTYGNQDRSQNTWNRSNQPLSDQIQSQSSRFDRRNPFENKSPPIRNVWENSSRQNVEPLSQNTYSNESKSTFEPRPEKPPSNKYQPKGNFNEEVSGVSQTQPGAGGEVPKKERSIDTATLMRKDAAYKLQATADIVREMSRNKKLHIPRLILKPLKKSVHARLEVLLVESLGISQIDMVAQYRRRFPRYRDTYFVKAIKQRVEEAAKQEENSKLSADVTKDPPAKSPVQAPTVTPSQSSDAPRPTVAPSGTSRPTVPRSQATPSTVTPSQATPPTVTPSQASQPSVAKTQGEPPAVVGPPLKKIPQLMTPTDKLPTYPNADKTVYKAMKAQRKAENKDENFYHEDMAAKYPEEEAELRRHADAIEDIVKNELGNTDDAKEKTVCKQILKSILDPIRRAVILNVSKRLLNINVGLSVRVFPYGKPPKKAEVDSFMRQFDLVSLKKAKRGLMYVASCRTYRAYDELCAMGSAPLSEFTTLHFKPFQVAGPRMSVRERKQLRRQRTEEFFNQTVNCGADADQNDVEEGEGLLDEWDDEQADEEDVEGGAEEEEGGAEEAEAGAEEAEGGAEEAEGGAEEAEDWDVAAGQEDTEAQWGEAAGDGDQDEEDDINNYEDW